MLLRARRGDAERVHLRYVRDGEPAVVEAVVDQDDGDETWWRATFRVTNPVTRYWLCRRRTRYNWLNGNGLSGDRGGGIGRLRGHARRGRPRLAPLLGDLRDLPRPLRDHRSSAEGTVIGDREGVDDASDSGHDAARMFGGAFFAPARLDHIASLGANAIYLTPIFPADLAHATTRRPSIGEIPAVAALRRSPSWCPRRTPGISADRRSHAQPHRLTSRVVRDRIRSTRTRPTRLLPLRQGAARRLCLVSRRPVATEADWRSGELHARMRAVLRRWPTSLDGWRIDVANMAGRFRSVDLNHDVARWGAPHGALLVAERGHDYRPTSTAPVGTAR